LIEIRGCEIYDGVTHDASVLVVTLSEGKNKALNTNKNFLLLDDSPDLKKFTAKGKKIIEDFTSQIIINIKSTLFNEMISKKKECFSKVVNQDNTNLIEFVMDLSNSF
jgi:hypothetical protein